MKSWHRVAQDFEGERGTSRRSFLGGSLLGGSLAALGTGGWLRAGAAEQILPIRFTDIEIGGDVAERARQNFDRLETEYFQPAQVFQREVKHDWPGDTPGRLVLGLALLSQATHREAQYLDETLRLYPAKMNEQGYFGHLHNNDAIDEQQFSGHGWVLRGLCECYLWRKDERVLDMIQRIVKNLALPTRGFHKNYPIDPNLRKKTGAYAGTISGRIGNWSVSSDIGCDFIFLDGITQAYQLLQTRELKDLCQEMLSRFLEVDLAGIKVQTHSTLTTLRALLRYWEMTREPGLLEAVEQRYLLYRTEAMTENYENYNWFGRPEWTEPCAVVDSFMVATQLWQHTGKPGYLEDAHHIYFNGLTAGQRANGGFGANTCSGAHDPFLAISVYEAYWCCTMRGAEGLSRAVESAYYTTPSTLFVPFYWDSKANLQLADGVVTLGQTTGYPYAGSVAFDVLNSSLRGDVELRLVAPSWTSGHELRRNGEAVPCTHTEGFLSCQVPLAAGDKLALRFTQKTGSEPTFNRHSIPGCHTFRSGPLILGYELPTRGSEGPAKLALKGNAELIAAGPGVYRVKGADVQLARINDLNHRVIGPKDLCRRQILFQDA